MAKGVERPDYRKILKSISNDSGHGLMDVFRAWVRLMACALSLGAREDEYMAEIGRWKKEHADAFATAMGHLQLQMEARPFEDLLGDTFQEELSSGRAAQMGQFFTPTDVCRMMARVSFDVERFPRDHVAEICEPCAGSGRNVLAFWETMHEARLPLNCARATCWDLDPLAADMTVVNLTLTGIPAVVVEGNTLTQVAHKTTVNTFWKLARPLERIEGAVVELAMRQAMAILDEASKPLPSAEPIGSEAEVPADRAHSQNGSREDELIVSPAIDERGQYSFFLEAA